MLTPYPSNIFKTEEALHYIKQTLESGNTSGDNTYTGLCHNFLKEHFGFPNVLLTTSCTHALEMTALLLDLQPGDEVILPAYTFVSTANAYLLRGAKLVFADSGKRNPNIAPAEIERLITPKTKAVVIVHYSGVACDMDRIMSSVQKHGIALIEDCAHAFDSYYKGKALGTFGTFSTFSFHSTKNITCGEGGALVINDPNYIRRACIIREKGTNRTEFFQQKVNKYDWQDIGSSYLMADVLAALLYSQLIHYKEIQQKRIAAWETYYNMLSELADKHFSLPQIPDYATNNANIFYFLCPNSAERTKLLDYLNSKGISASFHYLTLYKSPYFKQKYIGNELPNSVEISECIIRLPLVTNTGFTDVVHVCDMIKEYYKNV